MNAQQITSEINKLKIKGAGDAYTAKTNAIIADAAATLANIFAQKNLCIVKGSSSPNTKDSFQRIYLEPTTNTTHDSRHKDYNVIAVWEWQTADKYGYHPISQLQIRQLCAALIKRAEKYTA